MVSTRRRGGRRSRQPAGTTGSYVLIARGADGRARCESFRDRGAYRSRLAQLGPSDGAVTLDEIVDLLAELQLRDA